MVRIATSTDPPPEWESLWREDPHATLFLHPRWTTALARAYPEYRPLYLTAVEGGRTLGMVPVLLTRRLGLAQYLSLPFGTHGGPLLAGEAELDVLTALARGFRSRSVGWRTLRFEMTVCDPPPSWWELLDRAIGVPAQEFRTHVVDLRVGMSRLWEDRYHKNTRNCVRMAERAGVTVAEEDGPRALRVLHTFHSRQSEGWVGIRPHRLEALEAVVAALGPDARIYVARRRGRPLAACLFLEHEGGEIHPWVSGAAPEAREPRAFHLLIHRAMSDACERGRTVWNFGGSGGNEKIEFFKESFAGEPRPVLRYFHMPGWARRFRKRPSWD